MKYLKLITSDSEIVRTNKFPTLYYNETNNKLILELGDFIIMTSESNPEAMAACYAKGWAAEADKMWKSEAEAVTSFSATEFATADIIHFEELKYFKNAVYNVLVDAPTRPECLFAIYNHMPSTIEVVEFPNTWKEIMYCCYNCASLKTVVIPNGVITIGNRGFTSCVSLTSVTIPNSVTSIGQDAFYNCPSLTSVTIGNSVTSIGNSAFSRCSSLTSIVITNSITSIVEGAFYGCSSLTSITVDPQNTVYHSDGNCCMKGSEIVFGCKTSVIPTTATSIGKYAFRECTKLTSITIPNSVTSIVEGAFYGCSSLTSVTIPNSVTSIGNGAFFQCISLTSVTIPNSVTSIGYSAFYGCSKLTSVTYNGTAYTSKSALTTALTSGGVTVGTDVFDYTALAA